MGQSLLFESRGAGSGSQYTEKNFSYTEIRNKRHWILSGEGAPFLFALLPQVYRAIALLFAVPLHTNKFIRPRKFGYKTTYLLSFLQI